MSLYSPRLVWEPAFDPEWAAKAVNMVEAGVSLSHLADIAGMPPYAVVRYWRTINPDFDAAIVAASEAKAERYADEIVPIADDTSRHPACREVSIKARMAMMKVYNRRKYDPATRVEVTQGPVVGDGLTTAELERMVAEQRARLSAIEGEAVRVTPGAPPLLEGAGSSGD